MLEFLPVTATNLTAGPARDRVDLGRHYLLSLDSRNLLRPFLFQAGLWSYSGSVGTTVGDPVDDAPSGWHWGWESPTSEVRGHILGHWLSAAAHLSATDGEVRAKAEAIVAELARCQAANGDGWVAGFGPDYLDRVARGVPVWAPQYTLHKLLMGLWDMSAVAGSEQAFEILVGMADFLHRFTDGRTRDELDDILDVETGGMLEVWADLYGRTGLAEHRELIERYDRPRFFDRLLAGDDVLTNRHANTQIPEILGAARAWEVTGDERWRRIVEAFWDAAVETRGTYCTGGSTSGEVWQPAGAISARLDRVQEHCTVYNLMRLAETLYRWTGERRFADFWERNLLNGIWAQQHRRTGMVAYFLPLGTDSEKQWGSPTGDFWCCHGTLLQAHAHPQTSIVQRDGDGLRISQFLASSTRVEVAGVPVTVTIAQDPVQGVVFGQTVSEAGVRAIQSVVDAVPTHRPDALVYEITVTADDPVHFPLRIRMPGWLTEPASATVDGVPIDVDSAVEWLELDREWSDVSIRLTFPTGLRRELAPGAEPLASFADGPVVLAALGGAPHDPIGIDDLEPDDERTHAWWNAGSWRLADDPGIRLRPLNQITDERYSVYFPAPPE